MTDNRDTYADKTTAHSDAVDDAIEKGIKILRKIILDDDKIEYDNPSPRTIAYIKHAAKIVGKSHGMLWSVERRFQKDGFDQEEIVNDLREWGILLDLPENKFENDLMEQG